MLRKIMYDPNNKYNLVKNLTKRNLEIKNAKTSKII